MICTVVCTKLFNSDADPWFIVMGVPTFWHTIRIHSIIFIFLSHMAYILYLHPVAPKSSLSVPYQWFLVIDQCMWEHFAVLRRHHVIYLTFNTINTSNLIYLRHPYGGFTRQQMILCCFCFHLAALSVNGRSERLLFQPLYKCRHISLINDTGIAVVQDDLHIKLFAADFSCLLLEAIRKLESGPVDPILPWWRSVWISLWQCTQTQCLKTIGPINTQF